MKALKVIGELVNGKKRAIGGLGYVIIDLLVSFGKIDLGTANTLKLVFGSVFGAGVGHAIAKAR